MAVIIFLIIILIVICQYNRLNSADDSIANSIKIPDDTINIDIAPTQYDYLIYSVESKRIEMQLLLSQSNLIINNVIRGVYTLSQLRREMDILAKIRHAASGIYEEMGQNINTIIQHYVSMDVTDKRRLLISKVNIEIDYGEIIANYLMVNRIISEITGEQ